MLKEKSQAQLAMDEIQASVRPFPKEFWFRARTRAFNRLTSDGLTQVVEFQMGRFDPPGTHYAGFKKNWYGKFAVNVGIYMQELHEYNFPCTRLSFVHEYDCWIRERLGNLGPEGQDIWWELQTAPEQSAEVCHRIERDAMPFFAKYETREKIIGEWIPGRATGQETDFVRFTRSRQQLACALILAKQERRDAARSCLRAALEYQPNHPSSARLRAFLLELETQV
ncbi:MAG: DUF4304 domain-containing protein [Terriglobales bacterium]